MEELTAGGFNPVLDDVKASNKADVTRVVLCSGKVYYDLDAAREEAPDPRVAIVRLEQFYPFPASRLVEIFASYPNATQLFWTQEEPHNMGGWHFVQDRLKAIIPANMELKYVGRTPSASPATGSYAIHELEQKQIVNQAMIIDTGEIAAASEPEVSEKLAPASS
jgi:2-oxoglutarate dehydrogenase E1 component